MEIGGATYVCRRRKGGGRLNCDDSKVYVIVIHGGVAWAPAGDSLSVDSTCKCEWTWCGCVVMEREECRDDDDERRM